MRLACSARLVISSALLLGIILPNNPLWAQQTAPKKPKRYANPIVSGQLPTKLLTVQYEWQAASDMPIDDIENGNVTPNRMTSVHQVRIGFQRNLITKPKLFWTLMGQYNYTQFQLQFPALNSFARVMDQDAFHQISVSSNLFKPLNEKHFFLFNASVEFNGNDGLGRWGANNLYVGGAAIFGWKKGFERMMGVGVLRAYRLGRVIHVPAFLYNRSFNKQWGVEALLPARATFRYKPGKKTSFLGGYDLEGGQYTLGSELPRWNNRFLQRGEIRPRIGLETPINKHFVFTLQTGVRINGRLSVTDSYAGPEKDQVLNLNQKPAPFVQAGIHLTRWPKAKR
jgi:hypothetical protein